LDEIFEPDADKEQRILFIQEWFGYCLIPDTAQHKFLWLCGAGGNGKSIMLEVMRELVGRENVSDLQPERFGNTFARSQLEGKLLNVSAEMSAQATVADSLLKAIVTGDVIEAEQKYKPGYSFRPFAKLVAATNELPRLLDLSDGFGRRAIILKFNRQFSEAEQDKQLKDKLLQELPGILVWAVQGLQRLKQRGRFDIPTSSEAAVNEYRREADSVRLFADEVLIEDLNRGTLPQDLYNDYVQWCRSSGFHCLNINNFGKRLSSLGYKKRPSNGKEYWKVKVRQDESVSGYHPWATPTHASPITKYQH